MTDKEVIPAFDMLLDELERIIPDLNAQGKALMDQKQYAQAHKLIDKAQSVIAFQGKVASLREEWLGMQIPSPQKEEPIVRQPRVRYKTDGKAGWTLQEEFFKPILVALDELGGRAHCQKVFRKLETSMGSRFTAKDWEKMPSNKNEIRWINNARWARMQLVKDGLLSNKSPNGIWEITQAGREYLRRTQAGLLL